MASSSSKETQKAPPVSRIDRRNRRGAQGELAHFFGYTGQRISAVTGRQSVRRVSKGRIPTPANNDSTFQAATRNVDSISQNGYPAANVPKNSGQEGRSLWKDLSSAQRIHLGCLLFSKINSFPSEPLQHNCVQTLIMKRPTCLTIRKSKPRLPDAISRYRISRPHGLKMPSRGGIHVCEAP